MGYMPHKRVKPKTQIHTNSYTGFPRRDLTKAGPALFCVTNLDDISSETVTVVYRDVILIQVILNRFTLQCKQFSGEIHIHRNQKI